MQTFRKVFTRLGGIDEHPLRATNTRKELVPSGFQVLTCVHPLDPDPTRTSSSWGRGQAGVSGDGNEGGAVVAGGNAWIAPQIPCGPNRTLQ